MAAYVRHSKETVIVNSAEDTGDLYMETAYLKEFIVLAKMCNYNRAADELFISQSSLFNHIKTLEAELSVPLFERSGKRIIVSEYGQMFLPYAHRIIDATEGFDNEVKEKKMDASRAILIGTQYRLTQLVRSFRSANKNYMLYTLDSRNVEETLYESGCELAFIRNLKDPEGKYNVVPYVKDSIAAVLYRSHPCANLKSVKLEALKRENFVMISSLKGKESDGISLCRQAGFTPKVVMTVLSVSEAAKLVNDELGISLLLKKTIIAENLDNVVLVDLDPVVDCTISLCWRKDIVLSEGACKVVEFVKNLNQQRKEE